MVTNSFAEPVAEPRCPCPIAHPATGQSWLQWECKRPEGFVSVRLPKRVQVTSFYQSFAGWGIIWSSKSMSKGDGYLQYSPNQLKIDVSWLHSPKKICFLFGYSRSQVYLRNPWQTPDMTLSKLDCSPSLSENWSSCRAPDASSKSSAWFPSYGLCQLLPSWLLVYYSSWR